MNKTSVARNKKHFNFTDAIIVTVLLIIITLLIKLFVGNYKEYIPAVDKFEYTVNVKNVKVEIASLFEDGHAVFDNETGNEIGVISGLSYSNSVYAEYDAEIGTYKYYNYPDLLDVTINIVSPYRKADNVNSINGVSITTGKHLVFRTKNVYSEGIISKTQIIEKEANGIHNIKTTEVPLDEK